jgi:hypothetical protein
MNTSINKSIIAFAILSIFALSANAQLSAPFAGGVKLQQGGATNPGFGLGMKAKQTYSSDFTMSWAQPSANGIVKMVNFGAGAGDLVVTNLDLSTDVGSTILSIANGGTGASTAVGALNNLLPSQATNGGKFLTTDGTNASWSTAVTSVGLALPAELTVSNSPVTSTGTLTAAWASQAANKIFASPDGAAGTPTFRDMTANDVPNLDASKIATGTLGVTRGGTGSTSFTGNAIITSNAAGTALTSQTLTDGQILIGSTGSAPVAATLTAGNGISITNAGGSITIGANTNATNKARVTLSTSAVTYTANAAPAGFTLSATSVINITVMEAGGYPVNATVTNINTTNNTFDFVISGYPTSGSSALITFQN